MVLDLIYIMYAAFLMFARDLASRHGRRRLFKYSKGWRRSLARAGRGQEATRVIFHSFRFKTQMHTWRSGQRVGFQSLKSRSSVRTMLGPILFTSLQFPHIFHIFSILTFSIHFNFFSYFISALKIIKIIFSFLHYFHKIFI